MNVTYPWKRAASVYEDDGPAERVEFEAGGARFVVRPTEFSGFDTGRRRYAVVCLSCTAEVHEATTSPAAQIKAHLRDAHLGPVCMNCGSPRDEHALANFADGPHVGAPLLVCPRSTFRGGE